MWKPGSMPHCRGVRSDLLGCCGCLSVSNSLQPVSSLFSADPPHTHTQLGQPLALVSPSLSPPGLDLNCGAEQEESSPEVSLDPEQWILI